MTIPKLRANLNVMASPVPGRPGLLLSDPFRYSDAQLVVPPLLVGGLAFFDGTRTELDLQAELARSLGNPEAAAVTGGLIDALGNAGFLEDETYSQLKADRRLAFAESPVRHAAHAGSAYPAELGPLLGLMQGYLGPPDTTASIQQGLTGIAAPHISPEGGWRCYRAAYQSLTPGLRGRTFVVLGTSHYGQPNKFGLTRKPYETPFGQTTVDLALVAELEAQPAAVAEDYCHSVEHSIEFQVLFLQAIYGPDIRVVPVLCGSFGQSIHDGGLPEDDEDVRRFFTALGEIAEREKSRLFWVLGVDMAHMGARYGDQFDAHANLDEMAAVKERDECRIECVNASDADGFWGLVGENENDDLKWCGSSAIYTFMKAVPQARGTLQRYEQWNIDDRSVVSFAGISFAK